MYTDIEVYECSFDKRHLHMCPVISALLPLKFIPRIDRVFSNMCCSCAVREGNIVHVKTVYRQVNKDRCLDGGLL